MEAQHIAFEINSVASALLGEPIPGQDHDNGPDDLTTKDQIVQYLKDAFAHAHRAVATLTNDNLLELTTDPFNPKARARASRRWEFSPGTRTITTDKWWSTCA